MVARQSTRKKPSKRTTKKAVGPSRNAARKKVLLDAKAEGTNVSNYLRALQSKKSGRKRNPDVVVKRIASLQESVKTTTGIRQLLAVQKIRDLRRDLENVSDAGNFAAFEKQFIACAASYSKRRGVEYGTWREVGVSAAVLRAAGISQQRS